MRCMLDSLVHMPVLKRLALHSPDVDELEYISGDEDYVTVMSSQLFCMR